MIWWRTSLKTIWKVFKRNVVKKLNQNKKFEKLFKSSWLEVLSTSNFYYENFHFLSFLFSTFFSYAFQVKIFFSLGGKRKMINRRLFKEMNFSKKQ